MESAHVCALRFVVPWLAKPETRATLQAKVRFSRTCRAGELYFDPAGIAFEQSRMEAEEDEVGLALEHGRAEMNADAAAVGLSMWRELAAESD